MRLLLLHAKEVWFKAVKEALREPPDPPMEARVEDCVVAFTSIERGDGPGEVEEAAREIVAHARRVGVERAVVYPFAHLSHDLEEPGRAHRLLVELERRVRDLLGGEVVRAPFGWYKAFRVHCAGHPMCELSRTIRGALRPLYAGKPLDETSEGPGAGLASERAWDQEAVKIHARFQLHPPGPLGDAIVYSIRLWLSWTSGVYGRAAYKRLYRASWAGESGVHAVREYLLSCTQALEVGGPGVIEAPVGVTVYWSGAPGAGEAISGVHGGLASRLERVKVGPGGLELPGSPGLDGELIAYKSRAGALVPLGLESQEVSCAGPDRVLAKAVLDTGLAAAEAGETPVLPTWLAPVQVAVIPVREEQVGYAEGIASRLAWEGVRVYLDPPTRGLGARIRAAARLWTPFIAVIGPREAETGTVTVRRRTPGREQETMPLEAFVEEVISEARSGPGWRPLPPPPSQ